MLRVLTKTATFVENIWYRAGEEILIAKHHFSDEVHTLLEDLDPEPEPAPAPEPTIIPVDEALEAAAGPAPIEELPT